MNSYDLVVETLAGSRLLEVSVRLRGGRGVAGKGTLVPTGDQVRPMLPRVAGGLPTYLFLWTLLLFARGACNTCSDCHTARHLGRCLRDALVATDSCCLCFLLLCLRLYDYDMVWEAPNPLEH